MAVRKGFVQKAWDKLTGECRSKDDLESIGIARFMAYSVPVSFSPRSRSWFPWARFAAQCPEASTNQSARAEGAEVW